MVLRRKKRGVAQESNSPSFGNTRDVTITYYSGGSKAEPPRSIPDCTVAFAGSDRKKKLTDIHNTFSSKNTASITQTVKGLGGVGKTMLAREYANQFARKNPNAAVWWFEAEDSQKIEQSVNTFLQAARQAEMRSGSVAQALQAWYGTHSGFLLIFDNVEKYEDIKAYLPNNALRQGWVLLTTRYKEGFPNLLDLGVYTPEDTKEYLREKLGQQTTDTDAQALGIRFGHFPLALSQAAAYIIKERLTISSYLKQFSDTEPKLEIDSDYEQLVQETWKLTTQRLSDNANRMLRLCAYLSADHLPVGEYDASPFRPLFAAKNEFEQALKELQNYSLVDDNNGIHRLFQEVLRNEDRGKGAYAAMLAEAIGMMKTALLGAMDDDDLFIALSPHASATAAHTEDYVKPTDKYVLDLKAQSVASAYEDRSKIDSKFKWFLLWTVAQLEKMLDTKEGTYKKLLGQDMLRNADGSIRRFGGYEWEVLKYSEDGKQALIITRGVVEQRAYDEVTEEEWDDNSYTGVTWEECSLRAWLNSSKTPQRSDGRAFDYTADGFLNRFSEAERAQIAEVTLQNPSMVYTTRNDTLIQTHGGNETSDKIFLLSIDELLDIFGIGRDEDEDVSKAVNRFESDIRLLDTDERWHENYKESWDKWWEKQYPWSDKLIACNKKQTFWWWLRSPGYISYTAASVNNYGLVNLTGNITFRAAGGVRPALWLNL